jgi:hypothetical protein
MMGEFVTGASIGTGISVLGGLALLLYALLQRERKCPECGVALPKARKPANSKQALWGGWTCHECGCEVDRQGRMIGR